MSQASATHLYASSSHTLGKSTSPAPPLLLAECVSRPVSYAPLPVSWRPDVGTWKPRLWVPLPDTQSTALSAIMISWNDTCGATWTNRAYKLSHAHVWQHRKLRSQDVVFAVCTQHHTAEAYLSL